MSIETAGQDTPLAADWARIPPEDHALLAEVAQRWGYVEVEKMTLGVNGVYAFIHDAPDGEGGVLKVVPRQGRSADLPGLVGATREEQVLRVFDEQPMPPVPLPKLLWSDPASGARLITRIPGFSANQPTFRAFSEMQGSGIGRAVGSYLAWLKAIDPQTFSERVSKPHFGWDEAFAAGIGVFQDERFPTLSRIAQTLRAELHDRYPKGVEAVGTQVVQDDIHGANILFDVQDGCKVSGIVDFECVVIGEVERAMRFLHFVDRRVLASCVETYESITKQTVDIDKVVWWAKAVAVNALCTLAAKGIPSVPWFVIHCERVLKLYPTEPWEELRTAISANKPLSKKDELFEGLLDIYVSDVAERVRTDEPIIATERWNYL